MLRCPITDLLSEADCYQYLLDLLHLAGLDCPLGHDLPVDQAPHKQERGAVVSYRCGAVIPSLISSLARCFRARSFTQIGRMG
jgi:hypothetical protein